MRVEAEREGRVAPQRLAPTVVGQLDGVRQRHVGERVRRRVRDGPGHVGDAVEDGVVHAVRRLGVRGRARVLEAAALVDRDVDEDRAGLHPRDEVVAHEHRRLRAGHQDGTDHHVCVDDRALHLVRIGRDRLQVALVDPVDLAQLVDVAVEQQHLGLHAERDRRRVHARDAGPDDHHLRGVHAGDTAHQHAAAALGPHEALRSHLRG